MVPIQYKTPIFLGFHRLIGWKVVPGGGIEPPTQRFSIPSLSTGLPLLRRNSAANANYVNDEDVMAEQRGFKPRGRFT